MSSSQKLHVQLSSVEVELRDRCEELSGSTSIGLTFPQFRNSDFTRDMLFWFPHETPSGVSTAIVSSRASQKLDEHGRWFDALRTEATHLADGNNFLVSANGTTTDGFLNRLSDLFHIPLLSFEPFPKKVDTQWFRQLSITNPDNGLHSTCFFKRLELSEHQDSKSTTDRLLVESARSVVLLSVRKNGNIHNSALARLESTDQAPTRLLVNRSLTTKTVESELRDRGAVAWWVYDELADSEEPATTQAPKLVASAAAKILTIDEIRTDQYLAHWTRRRVGPWPDQTTPEYLDDLIFQTSRRIHGELSTLCRILACDRIMGTNDLTRDQRDVVCFSNVPLEKIGEHRVFRPHLSRWDFEPYGIAVDKDFLRQLGARQVIYGEAADWDELADEDRPFFQLQKSSSLDVDWTTEEEWRLCDDLNLKTVPRDCAVVFVRTISAAKTVSNLSRWPIVVLEPES